MKKGGREFGKEQERVYGRRDGERKMINWNLKKIIFLETSLSGRKRS